MNANLKAASDCFIDESLLKCLVVNDNENNVYLLTSLIYVMLLVVAIILITSVFQSHCFIRATEIIEIILGHIGTASGPYGYPSANMT